MDCKEQGCGGQINYRDFQKIQFSNSFQCAHACQKCGRLYGGQGEPLYDSYGRKLFCFNGKIISK